MPKFELKTHLFESKLERDVAQAITKYMCEAGFQFHADHWRVCVKDMFAENVDYLYEFSSGGAVTHEELMSINEQDRLHIVYYDVFLGEEGFPEVKRRAAEIVIYVKTDDGSENKSVENNMYRIFCENYINALRHFDTRIFNDQIVKSGRNYIY